MPIPTDNDVDVFIAEIKKWFNPIEADNRPKISKWKWNFYELINASDTYRLISTTLYTNNMIIESDKNIKLTIPQGAGQVLPAATDHFTPRNIQYVQPVLYLSTTGETEYKFPENLTSMDDHPLDINITVDSNDYVHGDVTINFGEAFNFKLVEVIVPPNDYPPNYLIPAGCIIKSSGNWTGSTNIDGDDFDEAITVDSAWNIGNQEIRFVGKSHAGAIQKPDYFQILNSTGVVLETVPDWTAFASVSWLPGDTIDFKYKNSNTV
jgi:hypothetical protein